MLRLRVAVGVVGVEVVEVEVVDLRLELVLGQNKVDWSEDSVSK